MTQLATVLRVRAKLHGLDRHTAHQRLQNHLQALSWQPAGLPMQGILCIRQLRSVISLGQTGRPSPQHEHTWQRQLQTQLEACAANAARPALGVVPANANAVRFDDEAEQLACLTRDWLRGIVRQHWWWMPLLARSGVDEWVRAAWLDAPAHGPAALTQLAARDEAVPFLRRWPDAVVHELLQRVVTVFGLGYLEPVLAGMSDITSSATLPHIEVSGHRYEASISTPWQVWLSTLDWHSLSPAAACLLGIGLGLQSHAMHVRSPEFAQRVLAWMDEVSITRLHAAALNSPVAHVVTPVQRAIEASAQANPIAHAPSITPAIPIDVDESRVVPVEPIHDAPPKAHMNLDNPVVVQATDVASTSTYSAFTPLQNSDCTTRLYTEFGGTFYLVNVMLHLGWYADFTQPLQRGLDQNLYDLLACLGERACGERFRADALWETLAQLAGHAASQPPDDSPTEAWLAERIQAIRQRLTQALGDPEGDPAQKDWLAWVCAQPARITATSTRLDVFFSLEALPLDIRFSGLDRDPGWVPAAGRFIAFHFD